MGTTGQGRPGGAGTVTSMVLMVQLPTKRPRSSATQLRSVSVWRTAASIQASSSGRPVAGSRNGTRTDLMKSRASSGRNRLISGSVMGPV